MNQTSSVPFIIGHRGAAGLAPENTLASIRRAKVEGATWVEFDVMLSADNVAMLFHDDKLDRTTNGRGVMAKRTADALQDLDAGASFDPAFKGEPIPTLMETFAVLAAEGLGANIEIKPARGADVVTAEITCRLITEAWPATLPPPVVSSFSRLAMEVASDLIPATPRAMLFGKLPKNWRAVVDELTCTAVHMSHKHITPDLAAEVRTAGFPIRAYTVNDPKRADMLDAMGVTSIFTDRPDLFSS